MSYACLGVIWNPVGVPIVDGAPGWSHRRRIWAVAHPVSARAMQNICKYIFIFSPNVSIHPRCTLCTVGVECLVGSHFHWLFLASLSEIVPARFVTFVSSVVEVPLSARQLIISDPTSAFRLRRLVADSLERLVQCDFHSLNVSPKTISC